MQLLRTAGGEELVIIFLHGMVVLVLCCFVFQTLGDKDHMTHDKLHIMVALPPHAAISCDTWFEFVMVCGKLKFSLQSKNVKEFLPVWI